MLLSLDGTFVLQIINFVIFWALLNYLFIAPTRRAIEERQRFIQGRYAEAQELDEAAAKLRQQAEDILGQARRQTHEIMRAATSDAEAAARDVDARALEEANALIQLAQATVANERMKAIESQGPFVEELARTMVARATALEHVA